jgi:hypothetical protein
MLDQFRERPRETLAGILDRRECCRGFFSTSAAVNVSGS